MTRNTFDNGASMLKYHTGNDLLYYSYWNEDVHTANIRCEHMLEITTNKKRMKKVPQNRTGCREIQMKGW